MSDEKIKPQVNLSHPYTGWIETDEKLQEALQSTWSMFGPRLTDQGKPVEFNEFKKHFADELVALVMEELDNRPARPIHWTGTELQVIKLVELLVENGLIVTDGEEIYAYIAKHFVNKKGEPFKKSQLNSAGQQRSPDREGLIKDIVRSVARSDAPTQDRQPLIDRRK